jgi:hypothetical protein
MVCIFILNDEHLEEMHVLPILWAITSMQKPMLYGYLNLKKTFNLVFRIFQNQRTINSNSLKNHNQRIVGLSNFKSLKNLQFV